MQPKPLFQNSIRRYFHVVFQLFKNLWASLVKDWIRMLQLQSKSSADSNVGNRKRKLDDNEEESRLLESQLASLTKRAQNESTSTDRSSTGKVCTQFFQYNWFFFWNFQRFHLRRKHENAKVVKSCCVAVVAHKVVFTTKTIYGRIIWNWNDFSVASVQKAITERFTHCCGIAIYNAGF